jgi:hypothetical protein
MHCDNDELNLGANAHLLVVSWLQKADEDGGSVFLTMVLAGVVDFLTGGLSLKDTSVQVSTSTLI